MTQKSPDKLTRSRRLIEDWLPIAELSVECSREASAALKPAPNRLHVWWARRPLVASRAAILASVFPPSYSHDRLKHALGIHGDPVEAKLRITRANAEGLNLGADPYGYRRAYTYVPTASEVPGINSDFTVLDPTAGGGSIPFESARLGAKTLANDLNPVAALVLKGTVLLPHIHGPALMRRYQELSARFKSLAEPRLAGLFPPETAPIVSVDGYLWARTVQCPYCGGIVPLSPNWRLSSNGTGVRIVPRVTTEKRVVSFEIAARVQDHGHATINDGTGLCCFPDCGRTIDGDDIKRQAQDGKMGHQLFAVACKEKIEVTGKNGKLRAKLVRRFRAPRDEDDVTALVAEKLAQRMPAWKAQGVIPEEEIDVLSNYDRGHRMYGIFKWTDMFSPRQLFGHCTNVEVFRELFEELQVKHSGQLPEIDRAAMLYLAFALDKLLNYNAVSVRWITQREIVASVFDRHNYNFYWSYAEIAPAVTGFGYAWALEQTGKALQEIVDLTGRFGVDGNADLFRSSLPLPTIEIFNGTAESIPIPDATVDCVVMDPPYYDNVMYAELADFFYVWLKRTAGLLYPELFTSYLTDKDREAVANAAKFSGQKGGAKNLAGRDYQNRMAAIFTEQRRVLKPDGIMTVMFTHKARDAWDALATGLIEAGFVITASWPIQTEAESSLHIREKAAAKSTIFLVCRVRAEERKDAEPRYWEEVEPMVAERVREKVKSFQDAGLGGVDLYLACFGPALEVFSNAWPLTRGRARTESASQERRRKKQAVLFQEEEDPYAVRPEDALEAARREVKNWRLTQLATVSRQHHLDPLTEWYMLAWDTFRAPRFDADEALKLARVIGLDFDQQVRNVVCDLKTDQVTLWDSRTRHEKGKLGHVGDEVMIDTLHWIALTARDQNTGAAKTMLEGANLIDDPTLKTALEAMLRVLPQRATATAKGPGGLAGFAADFDALENLRRLAYEGDVPAPPEQFVLELGGGEDDEGE